MVSDPAIAALRRRIDTVGAEELSSVAARVSITLTDGRVLSHTVQSCSGSHDRPMSDEQLTEKCRQQAELVIGAGRAHALAGLCWELAGLADAADVARAAA